MTHTPFILCRRVNPFLCYKIICLFSRIFDEDDKNRVVLMTVDGESGSTFINASYINVS